MSIEITVEHLVAYVHTQNSLTESLIKRLLLIARLLIMKIKLHISVWGQRILHATILIHIRSSACHKYSQLELVFGLEPNIFHLIIFDCVVYVSIAPPQRTKMGPQRRLRIYVGYETPSIIKYHEPQISDIFFCPFC